MARKENEITYEDLYNELLGKYIPILTLNKRWHDVFFDGKSKEILSLEKELNELLKGQGRINTDKEDLTKLKKQLLNEIVANMDAGENSRAAKKIDKSVDLVEDINNKLILVEDRFLTIPNEIQETNTKLLLEGMSELCAKALQDKEDIENLNKLIDEARIEIKRKILLKQQKEEEYERINKFLDVTVGRRFKKKFENYLNKTE